MTILTHASGRTVEEGPVRKNEALRGGGPGREPVRSSRARWFTRMSSSSDVASDTAGPEEQGASSLWRWALIVLVPVAATGAVLSFDALHSRAEQVFGDPLAYAFPLLVDALILGSTLAYLAGAKVGRPRAGWRFTAHAGVIGTVVLNADAAHGWGEVLWHITPPAVWAALVELTGAELLGRWRAQHATVLAHIPARLWVTAPVESLRTWLRMARRLDGEQASARLDVGVHDAALHALELALPGWKNRKIRRILRRQLRAGSLPPAAILRPLGWMRDGGGGAALSNLDGPTVLRAVLGDAIRGVVDPQLSAAAPPPSSETDTAGSVTPPVAADPGPPARAEEEATTAAESEDHPTTPPLEPAETTPNEERAGDRGSTIQVGVEAGTDYQEAPAVPVQGPPRDVPAMSVPVEASTAPPAVDAALALNPTHPGPGLARTGDRVRDAVAVLEVHGREVTYRQMADHLRELGYDVPAGASTQQKILTDARRMFDATRPTRLAVVR